MRNTTVKYPIQIEDIGVDSGGETEVETEPIYTIHNDTL